jgi:hypothetical protein
MSNVSCISNAFRSTAALMRAIVLAGCGVALPVLAQTPGATVTIPAGEQPRAGGGQVPGLERDDRTTWSSHPSPGGVRGWRAILLADIDGDGRDDLCGSYGLANGQRAYGCVINHPARAFTGSLLQASAFNGAVDPTIHPTIRVIDRLGNGQRHLCGRTMEGIKCHRFNGSGFDAPVLVHTMFSDANYWNQAQYASTIAFPKQAGKHAICGRGVAGVMCYERIGSSATYSSTPNLAPAFRDSNGWSGAPYFSTLQYADINGDGHADVCGRGTSGVLCATYDFLSGTFSAASWVTTQFADAYGWTDPRYFPSLRVADVSGDGVADFCGRGTAGLYCGITRGFPGEFPSLTDVNTLVQSQMSDANNWGNPTANLASLLIADYDGDGKNDVCGLYTSHQGGYPEFFCAQSRSVASGAQFAPLVRRIKSIPVVDKVHAGRLYDTAPRTGFCWVTSMDNSVACSTQWVP